MSLEEMRRKQTLASFHKRSLLKALESDDSPRKRRSIKTETPSSPYKLQLGRTKTRNFTKRKRKSVTPKRRKARKSKSSDRSQESTPELLFIDRTRRKSETSYSEDTVILYHSARKVRRTLAKTSSPIVASPIFEPRVKKDSKRKVKSFERRSADDRLRDVSAEYQSQIGNTISDSDSNVLPPAKVRRTGATTTSPATKSPIFKPLVKKDSQTKVKSPEEQSADILLRDIPAEYLKQIGTAISDSDTDELRPEKVRQTSSPTSESVIFDSRFQKVPKKNVKSIEGRSADDPRDVPAESQIAITISDSDTEELHPRKEYVHNTYEASGKKRNFAALRYGWERVMDTRKSDHMWEEFVNKNHDQIEKYLKPVVTNDSRDDEPPFKRITLSPVTNNATRRIAEERNDGDSQRIRRKDSFGKKNPTAKAARRPKRTKATEEHGRRKVAPNQSGDWMDSADEYFNPFLEDVQFEKGGQNGGRMSISEFRKARNVEKGRLNKNPEPHEDSIVLPLNAAENCKESVLTTSARSVERLKMFASDSDSKDPQAKHRTIGGKTDVHRVKEVAPPVDTDSNLVGKRKIADISNGPRPSTSGGEEIGYMSPRDLRKIHRIRKYAQRIKMSQSGSNLERTAVKMKEEKVESRVDSSKVDLTVGKKSGSGTMHSKMQSRKTDRVKPSIRSVKILRNVKLVKQHKPSFL